MRSKIYYNDREELSWDLKLCPYCGDCPYFGVSIIGDSTVLSSAVRISYVLYILLLQMLYLHKL